MRGVVLLVFIAMVHSGTTDVPQKQKTLDEFKNKTENSLSNVKIKRENIDEFSWSNDTMRLPAEEKMGDQQSLNGSSRYSSAEMFPQNAVEGHQPHAGTSWFSKSAEMSREEKMKELRIETVKLQILTQLGLKTAPPVVAKQSESPSELVRILLSEDGEKNQRLLRDRSTDNGERLIIQVRNSGINCSKSGETYCREFHFDINSALNTSSASLWIYRIDRSSVMKISVSVSYSNLNKSSQGKRKKKLFGQVPNFGWNKVELPNIVLPELSNGTSHSTVEVRGLTIEDHGERRPFLVVTKVPHAPSRQRRAVECDTNEKCCLKPLRVSLAEIGFNWVIYPLHLEVNMCTGKCMLDHSKMNTHYERALTAILENDPSLYQSLGVCWTLCCKPKQMESVRVIYNDTEGYLHDQYITELTVKSCSCS